MSEARVEPYHFALVILVTEVGEGTEGPSRAGVGGKSLEGGRVRGGCGVKVAVKGVARGAPRVNALLSQSQNPPLGITWWAGMSGKDNFPTLFQYALDTLSCPVMSTEREQVFSNVKKLITSGEKPNWRRTLSRPTNA
jgi:hAT family C-terminal dimerisation region